MSVNEHSFGRFPVTMQNISLIAHLYRIRSPVAVFSYSWTENGTSTLERVSWFDAEARTGAEIKSDRTRAEVKSDRTSRRLGICEATVTFVGSMWP